MTFVNLLMKDFFINKVDISFNMLYACMENWFSLKVDNAKVVALDNQSC